MARVQGKVAFITGAARGQGRSHALHLAREGADIIAVDIAAQMPEVGYPMATPEDLAETVRQVEALGRKIVPVVADVRDRGALEAAVDQGIEQLGRLDFVIANAGIMPIYGPTSEVQGAYQASIDVMLTGVINTLEVTYPRMLDQGEGGSIVMTASMSALTPMARTPKALTLGTLGYAAAKAGVLIAMRNYASVLASANIRVNAISPTGVNTDMAKNEMIQTHYAIADEQDKATLVNALPVPWVEPEDISNTVLYLCSDDSRYVTGINIPVAAGATLR